MPVTVYSLPLTVIDEGMLISPLYFVSLLTTAAVFRASKTLYLMPSTSTTSAIAKQENNNAKVVMKRRFGNAWLNRLLSERVNDDFCFIVFIF